MIRKIQHLILALLLAGLALTLTITPIRADNPPSFLRMWGFGVDTGAGNFETCTSATTPCQAGSSGSGTGQFSFPTGVAVDSSGNVYVADTTNNRIQKFDNNGGSGTVLVSGLFLFLPFDVAVDSAGNIYAPDIGNNLIRKFDSSGGELAPLAMSGSGDGEVTGPLGVAVDQDDNVYVADTSNNRIQKFNSSGVFQWAEAGSGANQFNQPAAVAVDSSGNIYIADTNNNRIQKRDANGAFLAEWGTSGSGEGQFNSPSGIAVDRVGNVYVADTSNHRIQKFNSNGDFATQWGSIGNSENQFFEPGDLAFDSSGNVFVADGLNNRIQKFRLPPLSLIKTVDDDNPNPGQRITYTITVDNNDTVTANNAVISDTLPNDLTLAGSATLEGSGGSVALDAGDLPTLASGLTIGVGQRITVTFPVTVSTGLPANTVITNTAAVTSTEVVTPQTGSAIITIDSIGLTLNKAVSNDIPDPGERITYTLTISNSGLNDITGAVISDTLPDGLTFAGPVGLEGSSGSVALDAGDLPTLASGLSISVGQRITVTFPVTVNTGLPANAVIVNTAAVTSTEVVTPQTGSASITVNPVILTVWKFPSRIEDYFPNPGQRITYTISVSNSGFFSATNAVISDTLPNGLTFAGPVGLEGTSGTVAQDAGDLPTLASGLTITNGSTITVTLPVTVNTGQDHGTIIFNTAAVTSDEVTNPEFGLGFTVIITLNDTISPTFLIDDLLTGSPLITPTLGISLDTLFPIFEWYAAWDNGQTLNYILTLSSTLDIFSAQSTSISFTTSQTSFVSPIALSKGEYFWTVQAQDAAGNVNSPPIPPQNFTIAADSSKTTFLPIILKNK